MMEELSVSFSDVMKSGSSVKDVIAPSGFDFRSATRFQMGELFGKVFYLDMIAPQFTDELVKNLLSIQENISISMHIQTIEPLRAIKMLKEALSNIQKMKLFSFLLIHFLYHVF